MKMHTIFNHALAVVGMAGIISAVVVFKMFIFGVWG